MATRLFFFKEYLEQHYGQPLYRIPIDLPLSCPHRQRDSGRGCIFCAEDGARARHLRHHLDLPEQVRAGIAYVTRRYQAQPPYIAYFQSFTNTYAPVDTLRQYYDAVLSQADFKMMIVATRPDCLGDDVLDLLQEYQSRYDLWIELGVQSANDRTLQLINRGHDFAAVEQAVQRLHARNISCAAHIIVGLPREGMNDFIHTADALAALPFCGIKIHHLLVLKHTPLAKLYAEKKDEPGWFTVMNEFDYASALAQILPRLPSSWPLMRLTADADPETLIAPRWWMDKSQFLEYLQQFLDGDGQPHSPGGIPLVKTADGSFTLYHPVYRQHFHTLAGAASEAERKFVVPSRLAERLAQGPVRLLDIGFGLGYNAAAALATATPDRELTVDTLEKDRRAMEAAAEIFPSDHPTHQLIDALLAGGRWQQGNRQVILHLDDARKSVLALPPHAYDVIFMDGFSPEANPELWTYDFIRQLARLLRPDGILVTYSSAYPVIGALLRAGLHVGLTDAFGRKRSGIAASLQPEQLAVPLPEKELGIVIKSTAGVPWRDYALRQPAEAILQHRERLVARLRARGVPRWAKF